jgi:F0F1-type ATP synthase membrane subunit c/vacuolar-type H+-ATPase subunit K
MWTYDTDVAASGFVMSRVNSLTAHAIYTNTRAQEQITPTNFFIIIFSRTSHIDGLVFKRITLF